MRRDWPLFDKMIAEGYTGRKGKGGFYRLAARASEQRLKEAIDLKTGAIPPAAARRGWRASPPPKAGLKALVEHPDKGGRYAWRVLVRPVELRRALVPEIADDIAAVDDGDAQRLQLEIRALPAHRPARRRLVRRAPGAREAARAAAARQGGAEPAASIASRRRQVEELGLDGVYRRDAARPPGVLLLADIKRAGKPLAANGSASLWDIGDGVACLEFHSKMNSHRSRQLPAAAPIDRSGRQAQAEGAGDLQ